MLYRLYNRGSKHAMHAIMCRISFWLIDFFSLGRLETLTARRVAVSPRCRQQHQRHKNFDIPHNDTPLRQKRAAEHRARNYRTLVQIWWIKTLIMLEYNTLSCTERIQALISDGLIFFTCLILQRHKSTDQCIISKQLWMSSTLNWRPCSSM